MFDQRLTEVVPWVTVHSIVIALKSVESIEVDQSLYKYIG